MNKLTLAMIAKNEARWIDACLASVKGLVDEIVLVDTGSTDATVQIAKEHGARVYEHVWENDFAKARNISLSYVTTPWILVLDADEQLSPESFDAIRKLIDEPLADAYMLIQTNYSDLPNCLGWVPNMLNMKEAKGYKGYIDSPLVRLFRNSPELKFEGVLHEHVRDVTATKSVMTTDIRIHHYGFLSTPEVKEEKMKLYLELGIQKCHAYPRHAHTWYELAAQYWVMGKMEDARNCLNKCLTLDPRHIKGLLAMATYNNIKKDFKASIRNYLQVIDIDPNNEGPYLFLPEILSDVGQFDLAFHIIKLAEKILHHHPLFHSKKGVVLMKAGNYRRALECFETALTLSPDSPIVEYNRGLALLRLRDYPGALLAFKKSLSSDETINMGLSKIAEIYFETGHFAECEKHLLEAIGKFQDDDILRFQLASYYFSFNRYSQCREVISGIKCVENLTDSEQQKLLQMMEEIKNKQMLTAYHDDGDSHCHH